MEPKRTYSSKDIADLFGRSIDWWYRNRADYEKNHRFPEPLPGKRRTPNWTIALVDQWFENNGKDSEAQAKLTRDFNKRLDSYAGG